jgi:hypothetical protein
MPLCIVRVLSVILIIFDDDDGDGDNDMYESMVYSIHTIHFSANETNKIVEFGKRLVPLRVSQRLVCNVRSATINFAQFRNTVCGWCFWDCEVQGRPAVYALRKHTSTLSITPLYNI